MNSTDPLGLDDCQGKPGVVASFDSQGNPHCHPDPNAHNHYGPPPEPQDPGVPFFGNDIFDAISGAPGTYLTIDSHGNMSFGFSDQLWTYTENNVDNWRSALGARGVFFGAFQGQTYGPGVLATYGLSSPSTFELVRDFGPHSESTGLIFDTIAAQENWNRFVGSLPSEARSAYFDRLAEGKTADYVLSSAILRAEASGWNPGERLSQLVGQMGVVTTQWLSLVTVSFSPVWMVH